jgi:hypothetical protein
MKRMIAVLCCACALAVSGCLTLECTQVGCSTGLTLVLPVDVTESSASVELCRGDVCYPAFDVEQGAGAVQVADDDEVFIRASLQQPLDESSMNVMIETIYVAAESANAEPPAEEWTVTVRTGGGDEVTGSVLPEYERSAPNGEDCGPICYSANAVVQ